MSSNLNQSPVFNDGSKNFHPSFLFLPSIHKLKDKTVNCHPERQN